jgi:hypothetical protein
MRAPHAPDDPERTTAFGTWRFASEYLSAARAVNAAIDHPLDLCAPRYYLLGHGIELAIKAYLLAHRVPLSELRSMTLMGHDLVKALDRAVGLNLLDLVELSDEEVSAIRLLNETYRRKEHEYITTGATRWPPTDLLFRALDSLLGSTKDVCFQATIQVQ